MTMSNVPFGKLKILPVQRFAGATAIPRCNARAACQLRQRPAGTRQCAQRRDSRCRLPVAGRARRTQ